MRIDLSGAKTLDSLIPAGQYLATVTDVEIKESNDGPSDKNPTGLYAKWTFTLTGGDYDNWKQWKNTPLGGDGLGFLKEVLSATGSYTDDELDDIDTDEFEERCVGREVMISVRRKEYPRGSGEYTNDVGKVRKYEGTAGSLLP